MINDIVQMELSKIIIDEKRQEQIIVLKEKDGERQFPIMIGIVEASSIKMRLANMIPPRPLTHDLLVDVITATSFSVDSILIDKMVKNIFFAKIRIVNKNGLKRLIDSRPSDAIAVAVRAGVKIFVRSKILNKAEIF